MAYLTLTACGATGTQLPIDKQHQVTLHSYEEKFGLITDVVLAALVAVVAVGIIITANNLIDLGPLNALNTLGNQAAYIMLGVAGGVIILNMITVLIKMTRHINDLYKLNNEIVGRSDVQAADGLRQDFLASQQTLATAQKDVTQLTGINANLRKENGDLQGRVNDLTSKNNAAAALVSTTNQDRQRLAAELATLQAEATSLQTQIAALKATPATTPSRTLAEVQELHRLAKESLDTITAEKGALQAEADTLKAAPAATPAPATPARTLAEVEDLLKKATEKHTKAAEETNQLAAEMTRLSAGPTVAEVQAQLQKAQEDLARLTTEKGALEKTKGTLEAEVTRLSTPPAPPAATGPTLAEVQADLQKTQDALRAAVDEKTRLSALITSAPVAAPTPAPAATGPSVADIDAQQKTAQAQLDAINREIEAKKDEIKRKGDELTQATDALTKQLAAVKLENDQIDLLQKQITALTTVELPKARQGLDQVQDEVKRVTAEKTALETEKGQLEAAVALLKTPAPAGKPAAAAPADAALLAEVKKAEDDLLKLIAQIDTKTKELKALTEIAIPQAQLALTQVEEAAKKTAEEQAKLVADAQSQLADVNAQIEAKAKELKAVENSHGDATEKLKQLNADFDGRQAQLNLLKKEHVQLTEDIRVLNEESIPAAQKDLLKAQADAAEIGKQSAAAAEEGIKERQALLKEAQDKAQAEMKKAGEDVQARLRYIGEAENTSQQQLAALSDEVRRLEGRQLTLRREIEEIERKHPSVAAPKAAPASKHAPVPAAAPQPHSPAPSTERSRTPPPATGLGTIPESPGLVASPNSKAQEEAWGRANGATVLRAVTWKGENKTLRDVALKYVHPDSRKEYDLLKLTFDFLNEEKRAGNKQHVESATRTDLNTLIALSTAIKNKEFESSEETDEDEQKRLIQELGKLTQEMTGHLRAIYADKVNLTNVPLIQLFFR